MKMMPWLMQVMRSRVCLKEEKKGWGGGMGTEGRGGPEGEGGRGWEERHHHP